MKAVMIMAAILLGVAHATAAQNAGSWDAVDRVFGSPGKDLPGDVHRLGWPRTDLAVSLAGVPIEPAFALGSWAAFKRTSAGNAAVTMGDLVLLGSEVNAVIEELQAGGFEVLAIHNHLIDETPRLLYVHFHGHGDAASLARTLRTALEKTKTPLAPSAGKAPVKPSEAEEKTFRKLQETLGRQGSMAGRVLQIGVPRAEAIHNGGMETPPGMGMATAINFEIAGDRVATTGDFVLVADEVNSVIRELHAHGIDVTALHSHMLRETPRLFFLHFWGVGAPENIAEGVRAALAKVATK